MAVVAIGLAASTAIVAPAPVGAVDTDMAISTTAIDFGTVNPGGTASVGVVLTNTGGDPFGPINMFGGAPPTQEFNASQNCQAQTLPAGGSCTVTYSFSPGGPGTFNDTSSFTISETANQSDGENFTVTLKGTGAGATTTTSPPTTTSTTSTTTTTTSTTTSTTTPTTGTTNPPGPTTPGAAPTTAASTTTTSGLSTTTSLPTWPLTGIGVSPWPALVVVVDNVDAEPQTGLNLADIVFELIYEGRTSRFLAVFNSMEANPVGPIRSARLHDIDLLLSLNDPAIAYSGANEGVNAALEAAGFELLGQDAPGFFRDEELQPPHNLFANTNELWPQLVSSGNAVPILPYVPYGQAADGTAVAFAEVMVGDVAVRWDWDPAKGLFLRSQDGSPHELTEGQASADNVVVLVTQYGLNPDGGPNAETVGSGAAYIYTDGRKLEGTWSRQSPQDPFTFEADGQPLLLAPGRTWVEIVDEAHNLTDG
jgi:Protein of unknown function (DUF3048) N-terminal domain/Protein of unknown function (DUF3048) C-terminal domain/Abnormal spindle-like microcephaly-assoc'd, ASPM-SPD-2-Hydin